MRKRPERILLLRSGRHLSVALDVLRRAYPDCHVRAIVTPGTEATVAREGIGADDCFVYDARPQFDAWPLFASGLYFRALARGYDRVAVLWLDPDGSDRANVDRAALLLSPSGFDAITPDGRLLHRNTSTMVAREARSAVLSLATLVCLGALLYGPAKVTHLLRPCFSLLASWFSLSKSAARAVANEKRETVRLAGARSRRARNEKRLPVQS